MDVAAIQFPLKNDAVMENVTRLLQTADKRCLNTAKIFKLSNTTRIILLQIKNPIPVLTN